MNLINYFTNKDSSKKNNSNHSINKLSSKTKAKSNDNNSQESIGKEKLMNSSAKYIRTQHKLIKNKKQLLLIVRAVFILNIKVFNLHMF